MSLVNETNICACGKIKGLMNNTNWLRHTKSCKKRKSVLYTAKLNTFFKSSRLSNDVSDKGMSIFCLLLFSYKQVLLYNKLLLTIYFYN